MNAQVIADKKGNPEFAVLPWADYQAILDRVEELQDIVDAENVSAAIHAGEETFPQELVDRLMSGENPLKVWREYRGMTASALASLVGVTPSAISQIEGGKRGVSVDLLKKLAMALDVDMEDLVEV
jgi:DNA-binding XRE family transcriptional regulator